MGGGMDIKCRRPIPMESTDNGEAIGFLTWRRGQGQQPLESAT